jgi:hypothetical protein
MASEEPKFAKIQTQFKNLSSVAVSLNAASDELTRAVTVLDEALKKLSIGLTVWVNSLSADVPDPFYDVEQIGFCKVNGKWGIALRRIWGNESMDDHQEEGPWLFNDAPRQMRVNSVDMLPKLVEELGKTAADATKKVRQKAEEVRELADAITAIADTPKPQSLTERMTTEELARKISKLNLSEVMSIAKKGGS